jgi:hypothetical protein
MKFDNVVIYTDLPGECDLYALVQQNSKSHHTEIKLFLSECLKHFLYSEYFVSVIYIKANEI